MEGISMPRLVFVSAWCDIEGETASLPFPLSIQTGDFVEIKTICYQ